MKLGRETGSLINHLQSVATRGQPTPAVGMGATVLGWTDRHAATIIDVFNVGKTQYVTVQYDDSRRTDTNGMSESQTYEYTPNPYGIKETYRFSGQTGQWQAVRKNTETGRWKKTSGYGLRIGVREKYHDFSF
jgi:hypothetical protein